MSLWQRADQGAPAHPLGRPSPSPYPVEESHMQGRSNWDPAALPVVAAAGRLPLVQLQVQLRVVAAAGRLQRLCELLQVHAIPPAEHGPPESPGYLVDPFREPSWARQELGCQIADAHPDGERLRFVPDCPQPCAGRHQQHPAPPEEWPKRMRLWIAKWLVPDSPHQHVKGLRFPAPQRE